MLRLARRKLKSWPLRALRLGITQSNMSTPERTAASRSYGVPMPMT
jgi:hypothetical protein